MKPSFLIVAVLMGYAGSPASAGTMVNGNWVPAGCGVKPEVPLVDDKDVDAYNKSVAAINDWQQKARTYYECLIKEANADNNVIADTANHEQAAYREAVQKIGTAVDAAKKKLDSK